MKSNKIIVSVCCLAYNHESYIRKCLEGFLIQKTDFPFEILIHDDASTDGTEEIIREYEAKYPNIIKPLYEKENQWQKGRRGSAIFNFPRARGKYIALCEGDDYWTDPYKLQKQVDFLEANEDYGMVHTELDHYFVKTNGFIKNYWKTIGVNNQQGDIYNTLFGNQGSGIYTCTVLFRQKFLNKLDYSMFSKYMFGDIPLWLFIASQSKIGYLEKSMAVRRVLLKSATQGNSFDYNLKFAKSGLQVFEDFNKIRPFKDDNKRKYLINHNKTICNICYSSRQNYPLFIESYNQIEKEYLNYDLKIKKFLFRHQIPVFFSRLILKISRLCTNDKK